jgi:hypothetical protein
MGKLRDKLARFMYGRYGVDKLYYALFALFWALFVLNLFLRSYALSVLMWADLLWMMSRSLSRNNYRRQLENEKFLKVWAKISTYFKVTYHRIKEYRTNVYRKCPRCKTMLRLPKRKGTHTVVCPKCKERFEVKI